ncbi:hypothetical protein OJAV_G00205100 [Oryzias javanicus]|uniref:Uncharacterized protein n=1 Tax=Oryzias javanicus TaxID=123683 RepID=A0A437C5Z5_ORYJA|nr:hypothetical protein OJAV_G00205100 [Oryzias javanicus]
MTRTEFQDEWCNHHRIENQALVAGNREDSDEETTSVEQQVEGFLKSTGKSMDTNNLEIYRPLPKRRETDRPAILMR